MIMKDLLKDNRVVSILRIGSVKSILNTMLDRLERCQKSLNEFLEEKRSSFPRLVMNESIYIVYTILGHIYMYLSFVLSLTDSISLEMTTFYRF